MTAPILAALTHPDSGDGAVPAQILAAVLPHLDHRIWVVDGVEPTDLLDLWADAPLVLLVTTCSDALHAGEVHRLDLGCSETLPACPTDLRGGIGLAEVLAVARAIEQAPQRVVLLTVSIAPTRFLASGEPVSAAVAAAVEPAGELIVAEFRPTMRELATAG